MLVALLASAVLVLDVAAPRGRVAGSCGGAASRGGGRVAFGALGSHGVGLDGGPTLHAPKHHESQILYGTESNWTKKQKRWQEEDLFDVEEEGEEEEEEGDGVVMASNRCKRQLAAARAVAVLFVGFICVP